MSATVAPRRAPWDPTFATRSPLFWPIADAARRFAEDATFPAPERIDALLADRAGIRFVRAAPKPTRRTRRRAGREALYDTRIVRDGEVPTRPGSWHDFLNALVWATFPRTKRALHARQAALVVPAAPGQVVHRPRALDALALFDEGGVVRLPDERVAVFGHAVYEGLVEGWPRPTVSALDVPGAELPVPALDAVLAGILADAGLFRDPEALDRCELADLEKQSSGARVEAPPRTP